MPARNSKSVDLTSKWGCWADELLASGKYQSASEGVRDGLGALHDDRERRANELAAIRVRLELAVAEAEEGKFAPGTGEAAVRRAFERARGDASAS